METAAYSEGWLKGARKLDVIDFRYFWEKHEGGNLNQSYSAIIQHTQQGLQSYSEGVNIRFVSETFGEKAMRFFFGIFFGTKLTVFNKFKKNLKPKHPYFFLWPKSADESYKSSWTF